MTQIGTRIVLPRRRAAEAVQAESVKAKRTILTAGGIEVFEAKTTRRQTQDLAITIPNNSNYGSNYDFKREGSALKRGASFL